LSDYSFYEHPPSAPTQGTKGLKPDDTPKSFLRLVNRKPRKELIAEGKIQVEKKNTLKIEPGESLHEFKRFTCCLTTDLQGRRVDQEIPVKMGGMNMKERRPKKRKPQATAEEDEEPAEKKKRYECAIMFILIRRRGKKAKKRRSVSPDPYGHLVKDVPFNQPVLAPPSLSLPKRPTKSSLPNSLSGAQKDLLESERQDIIARYRQRMGRT
jgi:hypothetical protein